MSNEKSPSGNKVDSKSGGQEAIERLLEAYGFTTRQALCDHLGISKGTLSNRYLRDTFPHDWIIDCSLETGASLRWLSLGEGPMFLDSSSDVLPIDRLKLIDGALHPSNYLMFDKALLPNSIKEPRVVLSDEISYVVDFGEKTITDGLWLISFDGVSSLRKLSRLPAGKVRVTGDEISFDCNLDEIRLVGRIVITILKN